MTKYIIFYRNVNKGLITVPSYLDNTEKLAEALKMVREYRFKLKLSARGIKEGRGSLAYGELVMIEAQG